jgi:hypothetical protein
LAHKLKWNLSLNIYDASLNLPEVLKPYGAVLALAGADSGKVEPAVGEAAETLP